MSCLSSRYFQTVLLNLCKFGLTSISLSAALCECGCGHKRETKSDWQAPVFRFLGAIHCKLWLNTYHEEVGCLFSEWIILNLWSKMFLKGVHISLHRPPFPSTFFRFKRTSSHHWRLLLTSVVLQSQIVQIFWCDLLIPGLFERFEG